jgi:uncharacterized membrane protein
MAGFPVALMRHVRFYGALVAGVLAGLTAYKFGLGAAALAGGDIFYLAFLLLCMPLLYQTSNDLKHRAKREDEGIVVVILITLVTMAFFAVAVFTALNEKAHGNYPGLVLAAAGVPLGWCVLHTVMAFHYASLHYFDDPEVETDEGDLKFPGDSEPGVWDFLYFSFVVGMTAQVSDVAVTTTPMRRAVMMHGVISFFFNTVLIAMAVNAAVAMAS